MTHIHPALLAWKEKSGAQQRTLSDAGELKMWFVILYERLAATPSCYLSKSIPALWGFLTDVWTRKHKRRGGHNPERWREWRRCVTLWPRCKPRQHETRIINPGLHYASAQKHKSTVGFGYRFCFHASDPETPECRDSILSFDNVLYRMRGRGD